MRTPLVIGLGILSFGLGCLTMKWIGGGDEVISTGDGENSGRTRNSVLRGGLGNFPSGHPLRATSAENGDVPTTESLIEVLDLWDEGESMRRIEPLLNGLDSDGLVELLQNIEREAVDPARKFAISLVGKHFGKVDPFAAFQFSSATQTARLIPLQTAIAGMIRESSSAALAAVTGVEDPVYRRRGLSEFMKTMSAMDPMLLATWIETDDAVKKYFLSSGGYRDLLKGMTVKSPVEAAAFVETLEAGAARDSGMRGLAKTWVQSDPAAAVAWAATLEGREQEFAYGRMIGELVVRDPEAAFQIFESSEKRKALIGPMMQSLAERDPEGALDWVATLEDPEEIGHAMRFVGGHALSEEGVEKMLGMIESLPDEQRKEAGQGLLSSWVRVDRAAALDWVEATDDLMEKEGYVREMMGDSQSFEAVELVKRFSVVDRRLRLASVFCLRWGCQRRLRKSAGGGSLPTRGADQIAGDGGGCCQLGQASAWGGRRICFRELRIRSGDA